MTPSCWAVWGSPLRPGGPGVSSYWTVHQRETGPRGASWRQLLSRLQLLVRGSAQARPGTGGHRGKHTELALQSFFQGFRLPGLLLSSAMWYRGSIWPGSINTFCFGAGWQKGRRSRDCSCNCPGVSRELKHVPAQVPQEDGTQWLQMVLRAWTNFAPAHVGVMTGRGKSWGLCRSTLG